MLVLFLISAHAIPVTLIPETSTPPSPRVLTVMDYHSITNSLIIFSGNTEISNVNEVWTFSLTSNQWDQKHSISRFVPGTFYLEPRKGSGGFASKFSNDFYTFGGITDLGPQNDLWKFNLDTLLWTKIETLFPPTPRYSFGFTSFVKNNIEYFIVFGGSMLTSDDNNIYILNMATLTWEVGSQSGKLPPKIHSCSLAYYKDGIYLAGGTVLGGKPYDDPKEVFQYDLINKKWKTLNLSSGYTQRFNNGLVILRDTLFILFGWSDQLNSNLNDIFFFNITNSDIIQTSLYVDTVGYRRDSFALCMVNDTYVAFGGYIGADGVYSNWLARVWPLENIVLTLSDEYRAPSPRYLHSFNLISGNFFLFGGKNDNDYYNDLWVFDPLSAIWESINAFGVIPSSRCGHAADSQGDAIVIWGGETSTGLSNELFLFNSLNNYWQIVKPFSGVIPNPAKGACLVVNIPHIYIYGGITNTGYSNELWEYNLWTDQYTKLSKDKRVAFATCSLYNSEFYVIFGTTTSSVTVNTIRKYNFTSNIWTEVNSINNTYLQGSQGIQLLYNSVTIKIGGQSWNINPKNTVVIVGDTVESVGTISEFPYNTGSLYYNLSIYSFGGASVSGGSLRSSVGHNRLISISMIDICSGGVCKIQCSSGMYGDSGVCNMCPAGSYSDGIGHKKCSLCPAGTFNRKMASTSNRQCYPCSEGTYANANGSAFCIDCPTGLYCPSGSSHPTDLLIDYIKTSIQPSIYSADKKDSIILLYQLVIGIIMSLIILIIICFKESWIYIEKLDIYTTLHNYELDTPMILKKTFIGGVFSIIFVTLAVILIGATSISFNYNNIIESKALVPLAVMQDEVSEFIAENMMIEIEFLRYGDACVSSNGGCSEGVVFSLINMKFKSENVRCWVNELKSCFIRLTYKGAVINTEANILVNLQEKLSYCSGISINVTSDSSIPGAISSIITSLTPSSGYVFVGSYPSIFTFTMTPSYFKSDSSDWPSGSTGYHVALNNNPAQGSEHLPIELSVATELSIEILLVNSRSSLFTYRYFKQTLLFVASSVLGSIFGIMGAIGATMKSFEKGVIMMTTINNKKKNMKHVINNSITLNINMNDVVNGNYSSGVETKANSLKKSNKKYNFMVTGTNSL